MASIDDLKFTVILYNGEAKVHRVELNYLLPNAYQVIENFFVKKGQPYYTKLEILRNEVVVYQKDLV